MNFLKSVLVVNLWSSYLKKHNPSQRSNFLGRVFKQKKTVNKAKRKLFI